MEAKAVKYYLTKVLRILTSAHDQNLYLAPHSRASRSKRI